MLNSPRSLLPLKVGSERFWPVTGDFPLEMEKAARILRAFTIDGIEQTVEKKSITGIKKQRKVAKKIPSRIMRAAKGVAIFTSMRSGMAPFGGAGGAGVIVARLEDGSECLLLRASERRRPSLTSRFAGWSAPSAMSPNNLSVGFMLGVDVYDCVLSEFAFDVLNAGDGGGRWRRKRPETRAYLALSVSPPKQSKLVKRETDVSTLLTVVRTEKALQTFMGHKVTLGAEFGIAAGPYGAGAAVEGGIDRSPVLSYGELAAPLTVWTREEADHAVALYSQKSRPVRWR
jgi:lipid-binding SYLF domain-containing protein